MYAKFVKYLYKYLVKKYNVEGYSKYEIMDAIINAMIGLKVNKHLANKFRNFLSGLLNIVAKTEAAVDREKHFVEYWNTHIVNFPKTNATLKSYGISKYKALYNEMERILNRIQKAGKPSTQYYDYDPKEVTAKAQQYLATYPNLIEVIDATQNVMSKVNNAESENAINKLVTDCKTSGILIQLADESSMKGILKDAYLSGDYQKFVDNMKDLAALLNNNKTADKYIAQFGKKSILPVVDDQQTKTPDPSVTKNYTWWYIGGGALLLTIIVIVMITRKNKRRR